MTHLPDEEALRAWVEPNVTPYRFQHILGVVEAVAELAARYELDARRLRVAALIHDCARDVPPAELRAQAEAMGISPRPVERRSPILLHGPVAARIAEEEWGVRDEEILEAIRWHTSGREGLSRFATAFFVADLVEPTRTFAHVAELRARARENLWDAALFAVEGNLRYFLAHGAVIDPLTLAWRDELLARLNSPSA